MNERVQLLCESAKDGAVDAASELVYRLEEGIRDVVHLHYYQGLSISETADALRIATSTVKYRLRKAMEVLRARIEPPVGIAAMNRERA